MNSVKHDFSESLSQPGAPVQLSWMSNARSAARGLHANAGRQTQALKTVTSSLTIEPSSPEPSSHNDL